MCTSNVLRITFLIESLIFSAVYFALHALDLSITPVLVRELLPNTDVASPIFLPHGLSVLVVWLYGLKSIPLLLLPAIWMQSWLSDSIGFGSISAHNPLLSLVALPLVFIAARKLGLRVTSAVTGFNWRHIMISGFVAGVLCASISSLMNGNSLEHFASLALGAIIGQIVFFALLLLGYRSLRLSPQPIFTSTKTDPA